MKLRMKNFHQSQRHGYLKIVRITLPRVGSKFSKIPIGNEILSDVVFEDHAQPH